MFVIAGVSGHVGAAAASELLGRKQQVKVIVREAQKGAAWAAKGAEVAVGSLEDSRFVATALRGARGFFTLLPPRYNAEDVYDWQRKTAEAIAAGVRESGVPHVVMLSSVGADLDAGNGPIKGLHHLENAIRATPAKLTAIRAGSFQENVGMAIGAARGAGTYPNFGMPHDMPLPMIATRDIGHLVAESLLAPPSKSEVIDLHGPAYSLRQVVDKLSAALGKTLQITDIPPAGWIPALQQAGLSKSMAEAMAEMYEGFGRGIIRPKGDRLVQGKTPIDETLPSLL